MKSPIGLFLTEFRTGAAAPAFASEPPDLAGFDAGDEGLAFAPLSDDPLLLSAPVVEADSEPADGPEDLAFSPEPSMASLPGETAMPVASHADALADARQHWAMEEGAALAQRFEAALAGFETHVADTLAPMLEPFLVKGAQLRVLDEFREAVRALLRGEERPAITITGPADLLAAIEAAFPGEPTLAFAVADTPDVTIAAGETLVQSRLRDWASALEESLGEAA